MTKLNKVLRREITLPKLRHPVIISIDHEEKTISLHEKGCRRRYSIGILELFELLILKGGRNG